MCMSRLCVGGCLCLSVCLFCGCTCMHVCMCVCVCVCVRACVCMCVCMCVCVCFCYCVHSTCIALEGGTGFTVTIDPNCVWCPDTRSCGVRDFTCPYVLFRTVPVINMPRTLHTSPSRTTASLQMFALFKYPPPRAKTHFGPHQIVACSAAACIHCHTEPCKTKFRP